ELAQGAPFFDGTGVLMGTAAPSFTLGQRKIATTKFNYGMSKVIGGKLCVHAFSTEITPDPHVLPEIDQTEIKHGIIGTSAWVALDSVVEKELLLENVGIGKGKLPKLPLADVR